MIPLFSSFAQRTGIVLFFLAAPPSLGRDIVAAMPSLPTGFSTAPAIARALSGGEDLGGLDLTLRLLTLHDSNVTQQSEEAQSDWLITPSLHASYLLGNSLWELGSRATLERDTYLDRSDFNATNYSLNLFGGYHSDKVVASVTSGIASTAGVNRFTNGFTEQFSYKSGLIARYHFSGKTSLLASWDQRTTESQTTGLGDTSSKTAGLSALWQATPLLSLGPGFRHGTRTGVDDEEFTLMGPTLHLAYQLSTKVKLRSSFGLDESDSPFSKSDTLLNWSFALSYQASIFWGFDLETIRDTQASLTQGGGFDEITSYKLNYWRKIRRARAALGISYEDRTPTDSLRTDVGIRDSSYLTLSAALTFPIYKDEADLTLNVLWRDQSALDSRFSWEGLQTGIGVQWRF